MCLCHYLEIIDLEIKNAGNSQTGRTSWRQYQNTEWKLRLLCWRVSICRKQRQQKPFTTDCNGTSYDGVRRDYCGTLRIKCSRYMGTPERICRTRAVTMIRQYIRKIEPVLWETNETGFCCRMRRKVKCRRNWSA